MATDNIFKFLDWVLKKKSVEPIDEKAVKIYMVNRWISMLDKDLANIVNMTINRWNHSNDSDDFLNQCRFYKTVLPKNTNKIQYIKKPNEEILDDDIDLQMNNMEISKREILIYRKLLAQLNTETK